MEGTRRTCNLETANKHFKYRSIHLRWTLTCFGNAFRISMGHNPQFCVDSDVFDQELMTSQLRKNDEYCWKFSNRWRLDLPVEEVHKCSSGPPSSPRKGLTLYTALDKVIGLAHQGGREAREVAEAYFISNIRRSTCIGDTSVSLSDKEVLCLAGEFQI